MKEGHQGPADDAPAKPRRKRSLRVEILVNTLVVGLIPVVLLALVAAFGLRTLAMTADDGVSATRETLASETVDSDLQQEADEVGRTVDRYLGERVDDIVRWSRQPLAADPTYLTSELEQQAAFVDLTFHPEPVDAPWWAEAAASGAHVGAPAFDGTGEHFVIPIAASVTDREGAMLGVLAGNLAVDRIQEIADSYALDGRQLTIVNQDRQLVAETESGHDTGRVGVKAISADDASPGVIAALGSGQGSVTESTTIAGFAPVTWTRTAAAVGADASKAVDGGTEWYVVVREPKSTAFAALGGLERLNQDLDRVRGQLAVVTAIVLLVACLACTVGAHFMASKLVTPVRRLTQRAQLLADKDLTTAAARPDDPELDFASLEDHSIDLNAGNELDELAASFDSVHRTAIRMASEQAHLRQITAEMFANLGRRNQSLVKRQLRFIEELERSEEDPDRLASLFKLDHLATRMRRNAESLLVIAGHRGNSRRSSPVRIELVTQAALGEVEGFERVDISAVEPAAIMGRAVAGLAHVLAELIENALSFSPPEAPVRVVGERGSTHYTMSVIDLGIGLLPDEIAAINERLALGSDSDLTSSKQLGLLVVAKLASRYGFEVQLLEAAAGGIAARVEIPNTLVQPPERGGTPRTGGRRALAYEQAPSQATSGTSELPPASAPPNPAAVARASSSDEQIEPSPVIVDDRRESSPPPRPAAPDLPIERRKPVAAPSPAPAGGSVSPASPTPSPTPAPAPAPKNSNGSTSPAVPTATDTDDAPIRRQRRRKSDARSDAPRYVGSLSRTASSQVTSVPRRTSKRQDPTVASDGADTTRPRAKRSVAVATSGEEVAEAAADVRNRWNRFRDGQRTATSAAGVAGEPTTGDEQRPDDA